MEPCPAVVLPACPMLQTGGHPLRHQRESQAGARAHTNHGGASVLTGKLKELWKPPEAITMEMVGGKDQNVRLRRRAGESKRLSTKLG